MTRPPELKRFEEGKRYVFCLKEFIKAMAYICEEAEYEPDPWAKKIDNKEVQIANARRGYVGKYLVMPEQCREISD